MVQSSGTGFVLPAGSVKKTQLEGEELSLKILGFHQFETWVEYPDGYRRHHQGHDLPSLLQKIDGQLRTRYNVTSYSIKAIPDSLSTGSTITIGDVKYA